MAEDPRDLIRAAQSAELAKDAPGALALLRRASQLYRAQGKSSRAEQIDRNAERLAAAQAPQAATAAESDLPKGSDPASDPPAPPATTRRPRPEVHRGVEPADPALLAWCSFCCRPSSEVGHLVTGPTGSFICAGCVGVAQGHLGEVPTTALGTASPVVAGELDAPEQDLFPWQDEALAELARVFELGARRVLLLGGVGLGKTRLLQALEEGGRGGRPGKSLGVLPVLVEEDWLSEPEGDRRALELASGRFVLAVNGGLVYPRLRLRARAGGDVQASTRVLPTTAELAEATGSRLPLSLLESVEAVVSIRPPTDAELRAVALKLLSALEPPRILSDAVIGTLSLAAIESGRGLHELRALVQRIPPGEWELGEGEG